MNVNILKKTQAPVCFRLGRREIQPLVFQNQVILFNGIPPKSFKTEIRLIEMNSKGEHVY